MAFRPTTIRKYLSIQARFNEEYRKGFRRAKILQDLAGEFHLEETTIENILCIDLSEHKPVESLSAE